MLYTADENDSFFIKPSAIELNDGIKVITWKNDDFQEYYNFEIQFPFEVVKDDFRYDAGGYFMNDFADYIDCISTVVFKDNRLIIGGLKSKP
jgi:hypothetical protein